MDAAAKLANAFVKDDMITIELEDGGGFTVQKALLSIASDYFDRAVNGRFMESSTKNPEAEGVDYGIVSAMPPLDLPSLSS